MVVEEILVVKLGPVAKTEPPVEAAYQLIIPVDGEGTADKVTVPVPHREPGVVEEKVGIGFTVATARTLVEEVQLALLDSA